MSVVVLREKAVDFSVTSTWAFTMTAPLWSVTTPERLPYVDCAIAVVAASTRNKPMIKVERANRRALRTRSIGHLSVSVFQEVGRSLAVNYCGEVTAR